MFKKLLTMSVAVMTLGIAATASANLIIAIDNTGSNDPVNVDSPRAWNFGVTQAGADYLKSTGITFDTAMFAAKKHEGTTAPLVFSLYSGLGGNVNGNKLIASVSISSGQFDNQYQDGSENLFKIAPQTFTVGYYSVTLTSTAPDKATQDYFLKEGKLVLQDTKNVALNSSYWLQDDSTGNATTTFNGVGNLGGGITPQVALVPEASTTFALLAITGISMSGSLLRRFKKAA